MAGVTSAELMLFMVSLICSFELAVAVSISCYPKFYWYKEKSCVDECPKDFTPDKDNNCVYCAGSEMFYQGRCVLKCPEETLYTAYVPGGCALKVHIYLVLGAILLFMLGFLLCCVFFYRCCRCGLCFKGRQCFTHLIRCKGNSNRDSGWSRLIDNDNNQSRNSQVV